MTLENWLDQFQQGRLHFGELPLAVEAYLHVGFALGRESLQREIEQLERDVNRLYNLAFTTDKDRRAQLEARLAQALEQATTEQWDQIEKDLAEMAKPLIPRLGPDNTPAIKEDHDNQAGSRPQRRAPDPVPIHRPNFAA